MGEIMSKKQILLIAIALGFAGGFSAVSIANGMAAAQPSAYAPADYGPADYATAG
jgi:hypothetical protein